MSVQPAAFNLVARRYAASARAAGESGCGARPAAVALRQGADRSTCSRRSPRSSPTTSARREQLLAHLREHPTLAAAQALLATRRRAAALPRADGRRRPTVGLAAEARRRAPSAVRRAARPLHRYRCAACGFEAEHYFWQCPGCLGWDTYPPQRLEDLMSAQRRTREQLAAGARPRRRRRDARPLLVRRGRADLARSAGAGGSRQRPQGAGAPRRRGQRRLERQGARRACQPA